MAELAGKVVLDLQQKKLFINGDEFPWAISDEGVSVSGMGRRDELPAVSLTFFAEDIEVVPEAEDQRD